MPVAVGIAVEVTHRSKRRLFGLRGLIPLRDAVRAPHRPNANRGRGWPLRRGENNGLRFPIAPDRLIDFGNCRLSLPFIQEF
jgi:hypothetical protein